MHVQMKLAIFLLANSMALSQTQSGDHSQNIGTNNGTVIQQNKTVLSVKPTLGSLKQRTNFLATQILEFVYDRESSLYAAKNEAIAQAFIDAIDGTSHREEFRTKFELRRKETQRIFEQDYWPNVLSLEAQLESLGIETAAIRQANALGSPRKVGFALSVLGDHIGKRPPYARVLTPLEAHVILREGVLPEAIVYADMNDANSRRTAETLQAELLKIGPHVNAKLQPLPPDGPEKHGINIVYPSADWGTTLTIETAFAEAGLEVTSEVRPMKQPPSILKIEVRPQSINWNSTPKPIGLITSQRSH